MHLLQPTLPLTREIHRGPTPGDFASLGLTSYGGRIGGISTSAIPVLGALSSLASIVYLLAKVCFNELRILTARNSILPLNVTIFRENAQAHLVDVLGFHAMNVVTLGVHSLLTQYAWPQYDNYRPPLRTTPRALVIDPDFYAK